VEKWMSQRKAAEAESLVSHPLSSPTPAAPAPAAARVPHAQRSAARVLLDDPTYTEEDVRLLDDPTYTEEDVRPTSARVNAGAVQAHAAPSVPSQQSRHAPPVVMWQPLLAPVAGGVQGPLLLTEEMLFNIPGISRPGADAAPAASAEPTASDEIAQQTTAEPRKRARVGRPPSSLLPPAEASRLALPPCASWKALLTRLSTGPCGRRRRRTTRQRGPRRRKRRRRRRARAERTARP
jgi:hypothetical protein